MNQSAEPSEVELPCDERIRLEREHERAGAALESARASVRSKIGISPLRSSRDSIAQRTRRGPHFSEPEFNSTGIFENMAAENTQPAHRVPPMVKAASFRRGPLH
jgi:hypothetical protein